MVVIAEQQDVPAAFSYSASWSKVHKSTIIPARPTTVLHIPKVILRSLPGSGRSSVSCSLKTTYPSGFRHSESSSHKLHCAPPPPTTPGAKAFRSSLVAACCFWRVSRNGPRHDSLVCMPGREYQKNMYVVRSTVPSDD